MCLIERRKWTTKQQDAVNRLQCLLALRRIRKNPFPLITAGGTASPIPLALPAVASNLSDQETTP